MKSAGKDSRLVLVLGGNKTWNDRVIYQLTVTTFFRLLRNGFIPIRIFSFES